MIRFRCDECGAAMGPNDHRRFIVKLEIYAAACHVDLDPDGQLNARRGLDDVLKELADADPDEVEDQTYRSFRFDLCDDCRRILQAKPLG